jgi:hypothetical protein
MTESMTLIVEDRSVSVGFPQPVGAGVSNQETLTAETIVGADVVLTDTLDNAPKVNASLLLFHNGLMRRQGAGNDYSISGVTITWLASTGTAPDMDVSDRLDAYYLS